jgi:hypothetical protein
MISTSYTIAKSKCQLSSLFVWLVADGWCWFVLREKYCWMVVDGWFVLREKYCWMVVDGWFVLREKYCWLVADKPSEQGSLTTY